MNFRCDFRFLPPFIGIVNHQNMQNMLSEVTGYELKSWLVVSRKEIQRLTRFNWNQNFKKKFDDAHGSAIKNERGTTSKRHNLKERCAKMRK